MQLRIQFYEPFYLVFLINAFASFSSQCECHAIATDSTSSIRRSSNSDTIWTDVPVHPKFSTSGFGGTSHPIGSGVTYKGNVGNPYCSSIIQTTAQDACLHKHVVRFQGSETEPWSIVIWNKYSSEGIMDGWYGRACKMLNLGVGEAKYFAFDNDSQGGWAAAPGSTIPIDSNGGYASTWGEFDFGSAINSGWSGFDVSAIAAQHAGFEIQGMKICDVLSRTCSYITPNCSLVSNAYTESEAEIGGIGGNIPPGPVRLSVILGYGTEGS